MAVTPVARYAVSDAVFAQLTEEILTGRFAADEPLPAERELAEQLQVNRHAVREALKRLQQCGLIRIVHGGKTMVLDWRANAGLDVLVELTTLGVLPAKAVLHDIAVMRMTVGADAAGRCAADGTDEQLARVTATAQAYPVDKVHPGQLTAIDLAFWRAVVDGSGNIAYRLALNTLSNGLDRMGTHLVAGMLTEFADRDAHLELAELITARNAAAAHKHAEAMLRRVVDALR
jgi:DNA-binding FadR family transcriptional regulator